MASRILNTQDVAEVLAEFEDIDREYFGMNNRVLDIDDDDNDTEADMNISEENIDPEHNDREVNQDIDDG